MNAYSLLVYPKGSDPDFQLFEQVDMITKPDTWILLHICHCATVNKTTVVSENINLIAKGCVSSVGELAHLM